MKALKEFVESNKENLIMTLKIVLAAVIIAVVFFLGIQYDRLTTKLKTPEKIEKKFTEPVKLDNLSVATTEKGELIMINRTTGDYVVYSEEVADAIFQSVGNRITK